MKLKLKILMILFSLTAEVIFPKSLKVLYPEGGKTYFGSVTIRWESIDVQRINIDLSYDGGNTWKTIADSIKAWPTNYLMYSTREINSDSCLIIIYDIEDPGVCDTTDNFFKIRPFPNFKIGFDYNKICINKISMGVDNLGFGSYIPSEFSNAKYAGFFWRISNQDIPMATVDGFIISGTVRNELRMSGSYIFNSFHPGQILPDYTADNPAKEIYRIWRTRKNFNSESNDSLRLSLKHDYENWPLEIGAPWVDVNNDHKFTTGTDTPYLCGDEDLFYKANDLDTLLSQFLFKADPLGLEMTNQVFAFCRGNFLDDVIFKKITFENKSSSAIENCYFSLYAFVWIGDGERDDVIGCDSLLQMAYGYNLYPNDIWLLQFGINIPPAIGHLLLKGPIIKSTSGDSVFVNGNYIKGHKEIGVSSFGPIDEDGFKFKMPTNKTEIYNLQNGLYAYGPPYIDPLTGNTTRFPLSGDPEFGGGWTESYSVIIGERAYFLTSGPFTLEPGESQEFIYAFFAAQGENNLNSVTELKKKAKLIREFYKDNLRFGNIQTGYIPPSNYYLSQNFPNPFNSSTKIRYEIPIQAHVNLSVYDILGRKVAEVVNKEQPAGYYEEEFNCDGLSSGVYFVRMEAFTFSKTIKLILLK